MLALLMRRFHFITPLKTKTPADFSAGVFILSFPYFLSHLVRQGPHTRVELVSGAVIDFE